MSDRDPGPAWVHLSADDRRRRAAVLDRLSGRDGIIVGAAVDHRDAMQSILAAHGISVDGAAVGELKTAVIAALAPHATLVLLDAEVGAPAAIAAGALPDTTALVMPLEASGYGDVSQVETTELVPGWGADAARRAGAVACKLLLPFRTDRREQAARQEEIAARCADDCRRAGMLLVLEPIVYAREGETLDPGAFADLVIAGAERLARVDPGILKLQYPGSAGTCAELDRACGPSTPWVLLGGGADADTLLERVADACRAGASGAIVGRTLWQEAVALAPEDRASVLATKSVPLLHAIADACRREGRSWRERVGSTEGGGVAAGLPSA